MAFYNWQGPSGKVRIGNETHFVELMGKIHTSELYNNLVKKPKKNMKNLKTQLFTRDRKIPSTWKKIGQIF